MSDHARGYAGLVGRPIAWALMCLGFIAVNVAAWFPGIMTWDSYHQYSEALSGRYSDWHPPVMAWLWRLFAPVTPAGSALLVMQVAIYWAALFTIARVLLVRGRVGAAAAVVAVGLFPPALVMNAFIWKDVGACVCLLLAFALTLSARAGEGWRVAPAIVCGVALAYALLVRSNAAFAVTPLAIYAVAPRIGRKPIWFAAANLVLIVVSLAAFTAANRFVFRAEDSHASNSLKMFDVAGSAHFARTTDMYPAGVPLALVDRCYTPQWWDALKIGECKVPLVRNRISSGAWLRTAAHHPAAYVRHRLTHFNEAMFAWVPARTYVYPISESDRYYRPVPRSPIEGLIIGWHADMAPFPPFSPAIYLVLALGVFMLMVSRTTPAAPLHAGAFFLSGSVLLYSLSFLIGGVANMYRYQCYLIVGALVAAVLFWAGRPAGRRIGRGEGVAAAAVVLTALMVTVARAGLA